MALGLLVAFRGRAMFPVVATLAAAWFVFSVLFFIGFLYLYTNDIHGTSDQTVESIIVVVLCILITVLISWIVKKNIWLLVGLTGILAGFSLGNLTFAVAVKAAGSGAIQSQTALYIWSIVFAIFGGILCCFFGQQVVLYGTSLLGSYLFMHGWALLFGGLPDEASMISRLAHHDRIRLKGEFMLYLVVFFGLFVLSCFVQRAG